MPWWRVIRLFFGNTDVTAAVCFWDLQPGRLRGWHDVDHTLRSHRTLNAAAAAHVVPTLHGIPLAGCTLPGVVDDLDRTPLLVSDSLKYPDDAIHPNIGLAN